MESIGRREPEYSSMIISKYRFWDADDNGPFKLIFSFSNRAMALMRFSVNNLQKCDLHLAQTGQSLVADFIS